MNFELPRPAIEFLLDSTVTASILVILIGVVQLTIGRRLSSGWRFLLWTPVLLRLLIPIFPESSLSLYNLLRWGENQPEITVAAQPIEITPSTAAPVLIQVERLTEVERAQRVLRDWEELLGTAGFLLWVVVAGALMLRLVVGTAWITFRLRRSRAASGDLQSILGQAANDLCLRRAPRLRETALVESPAVFGLLRPALLLPLGFGERLEAREIRHVFLHEMAHLKRRDLVVNWLMALAQAIHWFNPLVWLAFRQMRIERELACDAMALRAASGEDPQEYGRTILRLLEGVTARPHLAALVGIAEEKHSAKRRLQQIATFSPGKRRYWIAIPILLVLIVAGLTNARDTKVENALPDETGKTAASTGNEPIASTSTNAVYANQKRQAIARRLQEIIIPEFYVPGEIPLRTVLAYVSEESKKYDPESIGVPLLIGENAPAMDPATGVTKITEPSEQLEEFLVKIDPKLTNIRLSEVLKTIARNARPAHEGEAARRLTFSIEDFGVAFSERDALLTSSASSTAATEARKAAKGGKQTISEKLHSIIIPEFRVQEGARLGPILEALTKASEAADPRNTAIEFYMGEEAGGLDPEFEHEQPLLLNYLLPEMSFTDATVAEILERILAEAQPHTPEQTPLRVFYSIEDYGVIIHAEPKSETLLTRTYRLNAEAFLNKLEELQGPVPVNGAGELGRWPDYGPGIQSAVRRFLASAGIDFSASPSPLIPAQSEKAIFFNDRAGVLFIRAPLSDLDKVEQALLDLNLPPPASRDVSPPQVTIETRAVEFETAADFNRFMTRLIRLQKDPRAVLTRAEFDELMENLEKAPGTDILKLPRITTLSGRAARVSVGDIGEPALVIDLHPEYHPLDQTFTLEAAGYREDDSENKQSESGVLYNGQTLILGLAGHLLIYEMPMLTHNADGELVFRSTKVARLYFITPVLIDMAGNLIKNPGDPREEVPPQP